MPCPIIYASAEESADRAACNLTLGSLAGRLYCPVSLQRGCLSFSVHGSGQATSASMPKYYGYSSRVLCSSFTRTNTLQPLLRKMSNCKPPYPPIPSTDGHGPTFVDRHLFLLIILIRKFPPGISMYLTSSDTLFDSSSAFQ